MKKSIALLLVLVFGVAMLVGCGGGGSSGGGSGDVLKGTWTGTDDNGSDVIIEFDGKGGLKYSADKDKGSYTIDGDQVELRVDWWGSDYRSYTMKIDGNNLTLTRPDTAYYVNYDLTKK